VIAVPPPGSSTIPIGESICQQRLSGCFIPVKYKPSMEWRGNCYDNAAMESFWSTLKTEWLHQKTSKLTRRPLRHRVRNKK